MTTSFSPAPPATESGVPISYSIASPISRTARSRKCFSSVAARSRSSRASPCACSFIKGLFAAAVRSSLIERFLLEFTLGRERFGPVQIYLLADTDKIAREHVQVQSAGKVEKEKPEHQGHQGHHFLLCGVGGRLRGHLGH